MSLRFRKSIRLAPGIRLNLSAGGASVTMGPRGASINFGSRGTYLNTGIPGTGLYSRQRLGNTKTSGATDRMTYQTVAVQVRDDGSVRYVDVDGNAIPAEHVALAKKQNGTAIKQMIKEACEQINDRQKSLGNLHFLTPAPLPPKYKRQPFNKTIPMTPTAKRLGILGRLFDSFKKKIEAENLQSIEIYNLELQQWQESKNNHDAEQEKLRYFFEEQVLSDEVAMEQILQGSLSDICWPRETNVDFEIREVGTEVWLDVDLPEIEDMPTKQALVTNRGFEIEYKDNSETKTRQLYMQHIHSIGFRLIGEVFAVLPKCNLVVLSGYSQRSQNTTGQVTNQYLYSVKPTRDSWSTINFNNLSNLDVVESIAAFEHRRNMTKTGHFKEIQPFE